MQIGFIGLGKMGMNMITRLIRGGHSIVAFDTDKAKQAEAHQVGAQVISDVSAFTTKLTGPRVIWLMVPAGKITDQVITNLLPLLHTGDILIDGGNSNFRDSIQNAKRCEEKGIFLLDVGTSGGVWGLEKGYCLMIGGKQSAYEYVEPIFKTLAPKDGSLYLGNSGAGHYSKMVHNAIEYGMMQAYGEGFAMLEAAKDTLGFDYDLAALSHLWNQGSVVRSWLLELLELAFTDDPKLKAIAGQVQDSGEGRWTVKESIDAAVPTPVLTLALQMRFLSRMPNAFSARVCAALRNQFGGHAVTLIGDKAHDKK